MHQISLIPDFTIFIQFGIFLACFFVLRALVFKPFLELLALRHSKTTGLQSKASHDVERATELQTRYETFMKAERKKVTTWTDEERSRIAEEEKKIIQAARDSAAEELGGARKKIATEAEQARRELMPLVNEYSSQIASKLLGRRVSISVPTGPSKRSEAEKAVPT